jgi:hypothetical protein
MSPPGRDGRPNLSAEPPQASLPVDTSTVQGVEVEEPGYADWFDENEGALDDLYVKIAAHLRQPREEFVAREWETAKLNAEMKQRRLSAVPAAPAPSPLAAPPTRTLMDLLIESEYERLRARKEAQKRYDAEQVPRGEPFDLDLLSAHLRRPPLPPMRADGLIPSDASALIVAQRKTGKTVLALNYARSLLTGSPLLDRFPVRPIGGTVAFLNYEVSGQTIAQWATDLGIDPDRFVLVNLRGRRNPLAVPDDRARLAEALRSHSVESVLLDPFGRAYTGKSQNDSGEVGAWLVGLDEFARSEVGAPDLLLTAHAGWNGERTRGASALEDWADVIITTTRDAEDESQRYLRAVGRDVEVEEDRLLFDQETRVLSLAGLGSRQKAKVTRKAEGLVGFVERAAHENPGASTAEIEAAIRAMPDAPHFRSRDVSKARDLGVEMMLLRVDDLGPGKPKKHYSLMVQDGEK